ncbi:hypothetical protein LMG7141_04131 [Ralstonia condita]|uniref:Uncharacterized protein n=1 Tax=Ralstonia condita TaxID=3058600 RepID=A0ABM9JS98_9RALS|nr:MULTISPECIES: hypothetical protein [Ralstonia]CAJ0802592.1 hypothetical protein LMG7141_04131 [Ralstonia sp. LMG 7141]
MSEEKEMISGVSPALGNMQGKAVARDEQEGGVSQSGDFENGWDDLDADGKAHKEEILKEHFVKALERFNAGVSLTKIRKHYEKLGAKYSPVTFKKKWDELLKRDREQI